MEDENTEMITSVGDVITIVGVLAVSFVMLGVVMTLLWA